MTDEVFEPVERKPDEETQDVTDVINDESVEEGPPPEDDPATSPQPTVEGD